MKTEKQFQHSIYYLTGTIISALFPIISIPIFTKILSPSDYGLLSITLIFGGVVSGVSNLGLNSAFERNYFKYVGDANNSISKLLYSSIFFVSINFIFLIAFSFLFKDSISSFFSESPNNGNLFVLASLSQFLSTTILTFYFTFLKNQRNAKIFSLLKILNGVLNFIIALILILYLKIGVAGLLISQIATSIILLIILFFYFLDKVKLSFDKDILYESLRIGLPLTPKVFISIISTNLDKIFLSMLSSMGSLGIYHIAKKIAEIIFIFMTAMENVFSPLILDAMFNSKGEKTNNIEKLIFPFFYFSILFSMLLAFLSEELIFLTLPEKYQGASSIVMILSVYYSFGFIDKISGITILYLKKTHIPSLMSLLRLPIISILSINLIKYWGVIGASLATTITGVIMTGIGFFISNHYYKIFFNLNKILLVKSIYISGVLSLLIFDFDYIFTALLKMLFLCIYILIGIYFNVLTKTVVKDYYLLIKSKVRSVCRLV